MSFLSDLKLGEYGMSDAVQDVLDEEGIELRDVSESNKKMIAKLKKAIRSECD